MRSASLLAMLVACTGTTTDENPLTPESYTFPSRLDGDDSVSYSGQIFRHVLIDAMKARIGGLTERLDTSFFPVEGEVAAELDFYVRFDDAVGAELEHGLVLDPPALQATFGEISSGKNLVDKLAGNDFETDHEDWDTAFAGWPQEGVTSPESLVDAWIAEIDEAAVAWSTPPLGPGGEPVPAVHVTADGRDLQQLLEKFLRGAIGFSQGADDYLDDDVEGKGLLADHGEVEEGANHTALEHAWDEGFGYFGASRTFVDWSDDTIADVGHVDVNEDGTIDLLSEKAWGHSTNAAKRDRGAVVATDFTQDAWDGFVLGRALLAQTDEALTAEELDELRGYRDQALAAWESAIASTVVHYINDTIQDMDAIGTDAYVFADHAKHWSEMKGFALAFQFNPRSPMSGTQFDTLHAALGTAPALGTATEEERQAYRDGLLDARELLQQVYGFDAANMGGEDGLGGW